LGEREKTFTTEVTEDTEVRIQTAKKRRRNNFTAEIAEYAEIRIQTAKKRRRCSEKNIERGDAMGNQQRR
jgi:hypothetical protein